MPVNSVHNFCVLYWHNKFYYNLCQYRTQMSWVYYNLMFFGVLGLTQMFDLNWFSLNGHLPHKLMAFYFTTWLSAFKLIQRYNLVVIYTQNLYFGQYGDVYCSRIDINNAHILVSNVCPQGIVYE